MLKFAMLRAIYRTIKKIVKKIFFAIAKHEILFKVIMLAFYAYGMYIATGMTAYMQNYKFLQVAIGLIAILIIAIPYFKGLKVISDKAKEVGKKTPENTPETNE